MEYTFPLLFNKSIIIHVVNSKGICSMKIKEIAIIGMLSSLLLAIQVGLSFLPNIELVTLFIIIYTIHFRKKALYIISVFILLEGILYGFGLWWLNYLYIWYLLFILTMLVRKQASPVFWGIFAGIYGLSFGALCAIPYFFMGWAGNSIANGFQMAFAYWISGIPFDIPHGISNFILTLLLFHPLSIICNTLHRQ